MDCSSIGHWFESGRLGPLVYVEVKIKKAKKETTLLFIARSECERAPLCESVVHTSHLARAVQGFHSSRMVFAPLSSSPAEDKFIFAPMRHLNVGLRVITCAQ